MKFDEKEQQEFNKLVERFKGLFKDDELMKSEIPAFSRSISRRFGLSNSSAVKLIKEIMEL